jgi:hypothetical protein
MKQVAPGLAETTLHRLVNIMEQEELGLVHEKFFIGNRDSTCKRCGHEGGFTLQFMGNGDGGNEPTMWMCADCSNVQFFH